MPGIDIAISPATLPSWVPTKWEPEVLDAFFAPLVMDGRVRNYDKKVTGIPMQTLQVQQMSLVTDVAAGDNGEVAPTNVVDKKVSMVIDQRRAVKFVFVDWHDLQVAVQESEWSRYQGYALREGKEKFILGLEAGVTAATSFDTGTVNGSVPSLSDDDLIGMWINAGQQRWPLKNRHFLASPGQSGELMAISRHSSADWIGGGATDEMVVPTGKLKSIYGFEPIWTDLVRRYKRDGTNLVTVNMAWSGNVPGGGAFAVGVQQKVTMKYQEEDLQHKVIAWTMYGGLLQNQNYVWLMLSQNA